MTEEQVLSTLQTIFGVKLPTASEKAATENMDLPQIADLLKMKKSEEEKEQNNITTDQNNEQQQGAIITKSGLDNYNELISDILTEVLLKMAKGKISTFKNDFSNFYCMFLNSQDYLNCSDLSLFD